MTLSLPFKSAKRIPFVSALWKFKEDQRGNVAIIFALILIPLVLTIGLGADFGAASNYKHELQSATDAASLAGASAYTPSSGTAVPISVANNYMSKYIGQLNSGVNVSYSSSAATVGSKTQVTGYTVTVTATMQVQNSFMSVAGLIGKNDDTTTVSVSSTAENPVLTATFDMGDFVSYACDNNAIYWYVVPTGGGVPPASAMNLLWDNNAATPTSASFSLLGSQRIGFALKDVTEGHDGCTYGTPQTSYGEQPGDTQWFYSSIEPPSADYNIAPGGANTGTHGVYETTQNCSLVIEQGVNNSGLITYPPAPQGTCFTTSGSGENTNPPGNVYGGIIEGNGSGMTMDQSMGVQNGQSLSAPSCAALSGTHIQYDWNDMGGTTDSLNYGNDMQYNFSCAGMSGGGTSHGVYLVQ